MERATLNLSVLGLIQISHTATLRSLPHYLLLNVNGIAILSSDYYIWPNVKATFKYCNYYARLLYGNPHSSPSVWCQAHSLILEGGPASIDDDASSKLDLLTAFHHAGWVLTRKRPEGGNLVQWSCSEKQSFTTQAVYRRACHLALREMSMLQYRLKANEYLDSNNGGLNLTFNRNL